MIKNINAYFMSSLNNSFCEQNKCIINVLQFFYIFLSFNCLECKCLIPDVDIQSISCK